MEPGKPVVFEVTAAGFDAGTDESDDLVYWVSGQSRACVEDAIKDTGATLCGDVSARVGLADVDFHLPHQAAEFSTALLTKASEQRNCNRAVR